MQTVKSVANELKSILEEIGAADGLDDHPWTRSLVVRERVAADPALQRKSPGAQLLATLAGLFRETMPGTPPRRGKRIDTRWGQFGILAAMYFAPYEFGAVRPASLLDAWGRIDQVLPLFALGKPDHEAPEADLPRYRLIADDEDAAPSSTLSDWHVKGLERLAELLISREEYLSRREAAPSTVLGPPLSASNGGALPKTPDPLRTVLRDLRPQRPIRFWLLLLAGVLLLFAAWKSWRIFDLTRSLLTDLSGLQALTTAQPDADSLAGAGPLLAAARGHAAALRAEAAPFLPLRGLAAWLPVYGADLAVADRLLDMAEGMTEASDGAYRAAWPVWERIQAKGSRPPTAELLQMLLEAQPRLIASRRALDKALAARAEINPAHLSPRTRSLLQKADVYLPLLKDGLDAAIVLPKLLGAGEAGPQTYLLLLQNEDELRATGGFITAVGTVTVDRGQVVSYSLEDSYAVDDLSKPYLPAPWQLDRYMVSHIWLLRDSNWSPDFPTAAALAENLYVYTRGQAVDGVIAMDQAALRLLLQGVGPIEVEGAAGPVTADNVIAYMRSAKAPAPGEALDQEWWRQRKDFMRLLAGSLVARLQLDTALSLAGLSRLALQALTERHMLIQLDDPMAAAVLADRGWNGAVRPGPGDYLMVVDSNLGFNKANAAVETQLAYTVDLSLPDAPSATLVVTHRNPSRGPEGCKHAPDYGAGDYAELIARCYWDYLRVYLPAASALIDAAPQSIPAEWMIRGEAVPARVDTLDEIDGLAAFGTLLVVPLGQTVRTEFRFALPADIVIESANSTEWTYRLRIQKQAGTAAIPITLNIRLPAGAQLTEAIPKGASDQNEWTLETQLTTDLDVSLAYSRP